MATTDNAIQYDIKFFDRFFKCAFPDATAEQIAYARTLAQVGIIQTETLVEHAIAQVGGLTRESTVGRDFSDGSDAKKVVSNATVKTDYKSYWERQYTRYDYKVANVANKKGVLRVVGYNKLKKDFDFFKIPYSAYAGKKIVEITLQPNGDVRWGSQYGHCKVATFEELSA